MTPRGEQDAAASRVWALRKLWEEVRMWIRRGSMEHEAVQVSQVLRVLQWWRRRCTSYLLLAPQISCGRHCGRGNEAGCPFRDPRIMECGKVQVECGACMLRAIIYRSTMSAAVRQSRHGCPDALSCSSIAMRRTSPFTTVDFHHQEHHSSRNIKTTSEVILAPWCLYLKCVTLSSSPTAAAAGLQSGQR